MGLTFTKALTVAKGQRVTSAQHNSLARAFNDRILSGIGDFPWRITLWGLNLMSQIRNPSMLGGVPQWPAVDEWFKYYAHVSTPWPEAGPGEEAGVNLTNPMGAFVHGADWAQLLDEEQRTREVTDWIPDNDSLLAAWEAGKLQRGAIDLAAGRNDAPAIRTARRHHQIGYPSRSYFLKTYGGFFPTRDPYAEGCGDATLTDPETPIVRVRFSPYAPNELGLPVREWLCCCPAGSPGATMGSMIAGIGNTQTSFLIYTWGTDPITGEPAGVLSEVLSKDHYYEGPYDGGGYLQRGDGAQLDQVLHFWVREFRGSDAQRADRDYDVQASGFDFQHFLTHQYPLAPARGTWDPETETIVVTPPTWSESASRGAGAMTGSHSLAAGYVLAGCIGTATRLRKDVRVEVKVNGSGVVTFTVPVNGEQSSMIWLSNPPASGVVTVHLLTSLDLEAGGTFVVQLAELLAYKPTMQDAYLVLRCGSSNGGDAFGVGTQGDTMGSDFDGAKQISDDLATLGCITGNALPVQQEINLNPIHESARRMLNANLRLADRTLLRGYEVDDSGHSVLYFARNVGSGVDAADAWIGLAPSLDPVSSGQIQPGVQYRVERGVGVIYNGATVSAGSTFVGVFGVPDWDFIPQVSGGNEIVMEVDGIRATPGKAGRSNRWVMHISSNVYHTSGTSDWKDTVYDPSIRLMQRCHLYSEHVKRDPELREHFAYGQKPILISEAAPGHIYEHEFPAGGSYDSDDIKARFYRSCQIYPAPYEAVSITSVIVGGEQQVRVVLDRRLRNAPEDWYPTTSDMSTWTSDDITNRLYRTDENTLIQYLWLQHSGVNCTITIGDYALNAIGGNVTSLSDNPFGSCFPRCWFVRLVPEVWEDGNDSEESHDTPVSVDDYHQMTSYLRVMCEGFVDRESTLVHGCKDSGALLIDYDFARLMLEASGGQWSALPALPRSLRSDRTGNVAHAPVVNTAMYAEIWNLLAVGVNLLTRARVDLPMLVEGRTETFVKEQCVTPNIWDGSNKIVWRGAADASGGTSLGLSDWSEGISPAADSASVHYQGCGDSNWTLVTTRVQVDYRFRPLDPWAWNAIPESIRGLINARDAGFLGLETISYGGSEAVETTDYAETRDCNTAPHAFWNGVRGWKEVAHPGNTSTSQCGIFHSGRINPVPLPSRDYFAGFVSGAPCDSGADTSRQIVPIGTTFPIFVEVPLQ